MEQHIGDTVRIMEQTKTLMVEEDNIRLKIRYLGWAFPILIILIFVIFVSMFYSAIKNVEREKFFTRFEQKAVHILPLVTSEVTRVANALLPHYTAEVEKALSGDVPQLEERIVTEVAEFKKSFDDTISEEFAEALEKMKNDQIVVLNERFPQLKEDKEKQQLILNSMQNAMIDWIKGLLVNTLEQHALVFMDLKGVLDSGFKMEDGDKAKIDAEGLAAIWLEILNDTVHGEGTVIDPADKVTTSVEE